MLTTGNIVGFSLKEVIQMLGAVKKDGCLTVDAAEKIGNIYFIKGNIVDIKVEGDLCWEEAALNEGIIEENVFTEIKKSDTQFTDKLLSQEEIRLHISKFMLDGAFSILAWPNANYRFEVDDQVKKSVTGFEMRVDEVLDEIEKREQEWNEIFEIIPSLSCRIDLAENPAVQDIVLSREDWRVIFKLRATLTLEDLRSELNCSLLCLCKRLVSLRQRGLIGFFNHVDSKVRSIGVARRDKQGKYVKKDEDAVLPLEWSSYYQLLDARSLNRYPSRIKAAN